MINSDLENYIQSLRKQRIPEGRIKSQLIKAGWEESQVTEALSSEKSVAIDLPTPPVPRVAMWVTFLHIILFISLYISSFAFAGILNNAVDNLVKDPLTDEYGRSSYPLLFYFFSSDTDSILRFYLAILIISFPTFAVLFLYLKNLTLRKPLIRNLRSRKTLIYITLIGTFLILTFNLIKTVFNFLNGTVTSNFLAHVAVTLIVSGSIFIYYLLEVKEDRSLND